MKRKILSLICGLALMLTVFCIIVAGGINYHFDLGVVTASAVTTGKSTGLRSMSCSMYIITGSGTHRDSDTSPLTLTVTLSGYGNISVARSTCSVANSSEQVILVVN